MSFYKAFLVILAIGTADLASAGQADLDDQIVKLAAKIIQNMPTSSVDKQEVARVVSMLQIALSMLNGNVENIHNGQSIADLQDDQTIEDYLLERLDWSTVPEEQTPQEFVREMLQRYEIKKEASITLLKFVYAKIAPWFQDPRSKEAIMKAVEYISKLDPKIQSEDLREAIKDELVKRVEDPSKPTVDDMKDAVHAVLEQLTGIPAPANNLDSI